MKALVTGGSGFLGSHMCDAFLARGDEVVCLDIGPTDKIAHLLENPCFSFVKGSVLDRELVDELVQGCDAVVHLAAVVGVDSVLSGVLRNLQVNIHGTEAVLESAYKYGKKVLFSSTSEIYGRNPKVPWTEEDDLVIGATNIGRWSYAISKAACEHLCFAYAERGLRMIIVRYFNIYGPRLDTIGTGRVVSIFVGQAIKGEPLTVIGDGQQTRCFTYIDDAVAGNLAALEKPEAEGRVFNIGTDHEITILELANIVRELTGNRSEIVFVPKRSRYGEHFEDIPRRVPDITRMRTILGVEPQVSVREGLERTLNWYMEHRPVE